MFKTNPIQFSQLDNGRWKAKQELKTLGDHIAFGDSKDEAERKLRSSLKSHAYSITHTAEGYFG